MIAKTVSYRKGSVFQGNLPMSEAKYAAYEALGPFFEIVMKGLSGVVDGDHTSILSPRMRRSSSSTSSLGGPEQSGDAPS